MKAPMIDFKNKAFASFIHKAGNINSIRQLWGTQLVDGVEVMQKEINYYPSMTTKNKKLFQQLGVYNDLTSASTQGISRGYLLFDPAKDSGQFEDELAAGLINELLPIDEKKEFTIAIAYDYGYEMISSGYSAGRNLRNNNYIQAAPPSFYAGKSNDYIINELKTNYDSVFKTHLFNGDPFDKVTETISKYLLYAGSEIIVEVDSITRTITNRTSESIDHEGNRNIVKYLHETIGVNLSATRVTTVTNTSPIILKMIELSNSNDIRLSDEAAEVTSFSWSNKVKPWDNKTDEIWYKGQIRASIFDTKIDVNLTLDERLEVFNLFSGSGFDKKKVKWWKKIIAIVVFIIVVVILQQYELAPLIISIGIGAVVMSLTLAAMTAWGDEEGAAANAKSAAAINKFATIVNILNIINNTINNVMLQVAAKEAAIAAAKQVASEAVKSGATSVATTVAIQSTTSILVDVIGDMIMNMFKSSFTNLSFTSVVNKLTMIFKLVTNYKTKKEEKELSEKEKRIQMLETKNLEEESRNKDLARELIKSYTKQVEQDQGRYDIDYFYEPTARNICRRTFA